MAPTDGASSMGHELGMGVESFEEFVARVRADVDARLVSWLDARVTDASRRGADVGAVADALRQLVLRGGKRLRAVLAAAAYEACGGAVREVAAVAGASLELLQAYLLVHDDWMDGDAVRRGGPSVPAMMRDQFGSHGDAASILAGDLACGWAQSALLELAVEPARLVLAARELARVQEEVVSGQLLDVRGGARDAREVEAVHALKTASYTVRGPLLIGARLAGAPERRIAALDAFAEPLGVAFQLRDDVLGTFGNARAMGKPRGSDLREGKRTALVVDALGDRAAAAVLARVLGRREATAEEVNAAVAAIEACGARARVEERIAALVRAAREALVRAELAPLDRERLERAASAMTDREREMAKAFACGKVILLGEHAVVYGVPAIAVGIDRGARARATALEHGPSQLQVHGWNIVVREDDDAHDLARAFRALLAAVRADVPGLGPHAVEVEADLPPGGGLGCSAAMGVALARALDPRAGDDAVQARAMAWERVFHGNPSGVDAAVSARGGCVFFRRGEAVEPVRVRGALHLCIGHSGVASSTKSMVDAVAQLRARRPEVVAKSFEGVHSLVRNARLAIEAGDRFALGRLMDLNQMLLSGLFVSTPEIERMCALAREAGALGAKLTGAGGGGCVVSLVPSSATAEAVLGAWKSEGFEGFATCVAQEARARVLESETAP
jgi:mevalonate kinase